MKTLLTSSLLISTYKTSKKRIKWQGVEMEDISGNAVVGGFMSNQKTSLQNCFITMARLGMPIFSNQ